MTDTDFISRDRIVADTAHNFFVEAGAGSGKTTMLVNRMVAMVENGIAVDKICAITFTRAAAGEFYDRFQKKLSERAAVPGGMPARRPGALPAATAVSCRRCAEALKNIDLCFLGTIDAFCNLVLREHPARARIPADAAVCPEAEMETFRRREYSRILRGEYGEKLQARGLRFCAFHRAPAKVFAGSIGRVLRARSARIFYEPAPSGTADTLFAAEKTALAELLHAVSACPGAVLATNSATRAAQKTAMEKQTVLLGSWEQDLPGVIEALETLAGLRLGCEPAAIGITAEGLFRPVESRGKIKGWEIAPDSSAYPLRRLQELRYAATMDFLCACAGPIAETLRGEGRLTFDDCLLYLRDVLREDAGRDGALLRHIAARHSYFLIDEFQDTDPLQAEIFFYLTAQTPRTDWQACVPRPGSLFIVGDPKQSIYRFRDADVAAFLRVRDLFCGEVGEVLSLRRNFRSTRQLCGWFNGVFSELLPADAPSQSKFEPIPSDGGAAEQQQTFGGVFRYDCCNAAGADPALRDSRRAAEIIARLVGDPDCRIAGREGDPPHRISYRDFMLITPAKSGLSDYLRDFAAAGIPFTVEGNVAFERCPALAAVSAVLAAVARPNDLLYLYGALTNELFRVSKERLYALKNTGYELRIYREKREETDAQVGAILDALENLARRARGMTPSVLFTVILEEFHVLERVGTRNLEYLYYARELLRAAELSGEAASLQDGADVLARLVAGGSDIERSIALQPDANRVHIANLHKVKGLEAPIVLLAGRTLRPREPESRTEQHRPQPYCWLFRLADGAATENFPEPLRREEECLAAERTRLLYVAATRAKCALIIGCAKNRSGAEAANNLWAPFLPHCESNFFAALPARQAPAAFVRPAADAAALRRQGEAQSALAGTASRQMTVELCRPSTAPAGAIVSPENDYGSGEEKAAGGRGEDAALVGTMVHRLLEVLVSSHGKADLDALVRETVSQYGGGREEFSGLLHRVGLRMRGGGFAQQNGQPADLLGELQTAEEVHCELPFCWREEGDPAKLWHGVMDLVYRKGGQWHIVDYKTNADPDDLDEKYRAQTDAYLAAFRRTTGCEADARIYHIDVMDCRITPARRQEAIKNADHYRY